MASIIELAMRVALRLTDYPCLFVPFMPHATSLD